MSTIIKKIRETSPLVHHITNYVTVNDCANTTLAIGGSPIMADDVKEVAEITSIASALVINIGTLNERTVASMLLAGKTANQKGIPVILDPVGAGASTFRNETAKTLLDEVKFSVIRGNISEIRFLAGFHSETKGVDASAADMERIDEAQIVAKNLATHTGAIVAITGAVDIVTNAEEVVLVKNGVAQMSRITGTGCMVSSLIGSFVAVASHDLVRAVASSLVTMGIAGELAFERTKELGTGSFRIALIDALSQMDDEIFVKRGKFDEG